jgi:hypothetical protein
MHGSLVTSSLIRETTENESANEGYRFGQDQGAGKIRKHLIFKLLGSSLIENELIIANQCL